MRTLRFLAALFVTTVVCAVVWQNTATDLYDCTDDVLPGYFEFGWIHDLPNKPVKVVSRIVHGRDMNEPDTIKIGWSVRKLWLLWLVFFGASLVISIAVTGMPWMPLRSGH